MITPLRKMKILKFQGSWIAPISNTYGMVRNRGKRVHQGWDIEAKPGIDVYAIADCNLSKIYA